MSKTRYTKQQQERDEATLAIYGLRSMGFHANRDIVNQLAESLAGALRRMGRVDDIRSQLNATAVALEAERNKSLWQRVRERF